jgi:hypothetical protein
MWVHNRRLCLIACFGIGSEAATGKDAGDGARRRECVGPFLFWPYSILGGNWNQGIPAYLTPPSPPLPGDDSTTHCTLIALETTPLGTTSFRAAWAGLTTLHTPRNDTV